MTSFKLHLFQLAFISALKPVLETLISDCDLFFEGDESFYVTWTRSELFPDYLSMDGKSVKSEPSKTSWFVTLNDATTKSTAATPYRAKPKLESHVSLPMNSTHSHTQVAKLKKANSTGSMTSKPGASSGSISANPECPKAISEESSLLQKSKPSVPEKPVTAPQTMTPKGELKKSDRNFVVLSKKANIPHPDY